MSNPYSKYLGKEDHLQIAVAPYLDLNKYVWCHVPNEGKRTPFERYKAKQLGIKPGVPDVLIFHAMPGYCGLAIELKIKPNKPSKNQLHWISQLKNQGWKVSVCYSIDEFIAEINKYFKKP